jgi:hypothetical protein
MNGHRNYEIIRRRLITESCVILAPNEATAERIVMSANAWREINSELETIRTVECGPHGGRVE